MSRIHEFLSQVQTDYRLYLLFRNDREKTLASFGFTPEEREFLAEFEEGLSRFDFSGLGPKILPSSTSSVHYLMPDSDEVEFDRAALLSDPRIRETIAQIRGAAEADGRRVALRDLIRGLR
jgi:hypothetical protein